MDDALRDVVDLSTVVGTVSTALLTCNSPNYTKNEKHNYLQLSFYMFFIYNNSYQRPYDFITRFTKQKFFIQVFWKKIYVLTKILCEELHDNQEFLWIIRLYIYFGFFFFDLSCMIFHLSQPVETMVPWYTKSFWIMLLLILYVRKLYNSEISNFNPPPSQILFIIYTISHNFSEQNYSYIFWPNCKQ